MGRDAYGILDFDNERGIKMNKIIKIGIIIVIVIVILGSIGLIMFKPKFELNKAVEDLKYGNYQDAYDYIQNKNNEENKTIIKELITSIFCDKASSGIEKISDIATESTNIVEKIDIDNIDYTLDDNLNIDVEALDAYIAIEEKISKDMISEELAETYDLYFYILKYVRENFYDVLNNIDNEEFINEVSNLASDMTKMSNDCYSYADNHNFNPKATDIYQEIKKYIVN